MSDNILNVSRRGFLQGIVSTGALVLSVRLIPDLLWAAETSAGSHADHAVLHPSVYVGIDTDGTVYLVAHRSEMGTTSRTSVPLILADELDADWKRVKLEQAIGDPRYGDQDTDGSHSVRDGFVVMREAGATARLMLTRAAAQKWGVPVSECESDLHVIVHRASKRKAGYGELASAAAKLPVPKKEELQFKPKSAWRYMGKGAPSYDLAEICAGKAGYGMDARLEGMVYASVEHPPVLGGKVKSYDEKAPLQVKGVKQTIPIKPFTPPHRFQPLGGVAVIADNTWAAFQGRKKLNVAWDNGANAGYNSDQYKKELQETARKPGKVARNIGDVDAVFAQGGKIMEAEYYIPHLAHATMEPPVALADFRDGKVTIWAPTQSPQAVQSTVAEELGIPKENVICHVPLLGGGFGRKSKPDYAAEAAILSKAVGKPVKVVWSREDDIKFGYYHAVAAMYIKAALDEKGKPTAWLQRSVYPPIGSTFALNTTYGDAGELGLGWTDLPFDIPNHRAENGPAENHVRIGWFRSVANIYHAFAAQSFANELAHASGRDSVEYLLELIGPARIVDVKASAPEYDNYGASTKDYPLDTARMRRVVELAAEKSGWGKRTPGKGSGMGIAVHRSFLTYVATVVEVEVDDKGEVKIPSVHTAVDAGIVVNPEATRAQFEGAAVFGTSIVRSGSITAKNGVIEQSNFNDYPVARINEGPYKTTVHIVDSDAPPAGVGEPGVPPFAPAVCNAIFAATGKRIRELPLSSTANA
ncbi:MAG: molybdopterin-dependent oxidoreductase [Acidobacteriia bacterium]|jgi:isoquinoline 1-oxidoreductase beta subunit|nr:molybdopterin-dependent oxidoreductase [Terriglobia bacterium]